MKVVILAGGFGTRISEESHLKPKPMIEIGGRPILWHIMKTYASYGFNEFILCLGYKGNVIRDYFLNYHKYNSDFTVDLSNGGEIQIHRSEAGSDWKITLVETGVSSMTGYRTKLCGKYCTESRFLLTYGETTSEELLAKFRVQIYKQDSQLILFDEIFDKNGIDR